MGSGGQGDGFSSQGDGFRGTGGWVQGDRGMGYFSSWGPAAYGSEYRIGVFVLYLSFKKG